MTNKSFLFQLQGRHYICRIPGPGTELLINRKEEAEVYRTIQPLHISEHIIYMNGDTGYKIAEYYEGHAIPGRMTGMMSQNAWSWCSACTIPG